MKKRLVLTLAVVLALCLTLSTFGVAVAEGPKAVKNPYKDQLKIGFIIDNIGHPVGNAWKVGAEEEVAAYPNITLQSFDGKSSAETEIQQMTDLINQQYDGILLQATDSAALAASVREAEAAGIPVITLNLDADTPHTALVAMVDYEAGRMVADAIAASIGNKGNVVIIQASPGASRGINLEAGFEDELKNFPDITLLDKQSGEWLTEKANEVMRDFLTKYDKIDGVFCENDAMAEGASQAAEALGRLNEMVLWGADGESKALDYIDQGKMTGTIYTNCYDQGKTAFRLMLYALNSEIQPSTYTATPVVKMSPVVVTKDNLNLIPENIRW